MRIVANILFGLGALVILDGVAAQFLHFSIIAPLVGGRVVPFFIVAAGVGIMLICAVFKTIADTQDARKAQAIKESEPS